MNGNIVYDIYIFSKKYAVIKQNNYIGYFTFFVLQNQAKG